jgi:hypothetical protein
LTLGFALLFSLSVLEPTHASVAATPEKGKAVSLRSAISDCKAHRITTLTELMERHKRAREQGEPLRYLYSPKWGWLDLAHFSLGAYLYSYFGSLGLELFSSYYEKTQAKASQYSYEDLPSNAMGAFFSVEVKKPLCESLKSYLTDLGFVENPLQEAPNGKHLDTGVKNKSYRPLYTKARPEQYGEHDKRLEKFITSLSSAH